MRPGSWRGGPSGLLTDLPDRLWEDIALAAREPEEHPPNGPDTSEPLLEGCVELVLESIEAPIWLAPHDPVRDSWPVVAAAWQHPGVFEALTRRLDHTFDALEVADTAKRLGGVGRLAGLSGHPDVVDVHVVLHAMVHDRTVLTSDPDDLLAVHPSVRLVVV